MRDQNRVVVRVERPVVLEEVQQVRHLLQVRRDVRVVPQEVDVVELQIDDVFDLSVVAELAVRPGPVGRMPGLAVDGLRGARERGRDRDDSRERKQRAQLSSPSHELLSPRSLPQVARESTPPGDGAGDLIDRSLQSPRDLEGGGASAGVGGAGCARREYNWTVTPGPVAARR